MYVKRKQNESIGGFLGRFRRLAQQSRVVQNVKERRYRAKPLTERKQRHRAIMGTALHGLRTNLQRMGKYTDEVFSTEKKKLKRTIKL